MLCHSFQGRGRCCQCRQHTNCFLRRDFGVRFSKCGASRLHRRHRSLYVKCDRLQVQIAPDGVRLCFCPTAAGFVFDGKTAWGLSHLGPLIVLESMFQPDARRSQAGEVGIKPRSVQSSRPHSSTGFHRTSRVDDAAYTDRPDMERRRRVLPGTSRRSPGAQSLRGRFAGHTGVDCDRSSEDVQ